MKYAGIDDARLDHIVQNSVKDMHVKGFDYICLHRSPDITTKLYFFDGDVWKLPEVVAPHDHRYDFHTNVLAGGSENVWYEKNKGQAVPLDKIHVLNRFEYRTPMNGGDGFVFAGMETLIETRREQFRANRHGYFMHAEELHTIRLCENETVLMLRQFEDVVPLDKPTMTYFTGDAPKLDGLYTRFTADQVIDRLNRFKEKTGIDFLPRAEAA